jgi:hypothetical protein
MNFASLSELDDMQHSAERQAACSPRTRNKGGRVWDLLPPDTSPRTGDEIEDEGVWRPRPVIADCKTRYERALFRRREAEREYAANPCEDTQAKLEVALQEAREALRASGDETVRKWDRIEQWRAGDGRETYNASRRTVRVNPNADLSGMTDEQKAAHKREQARRRKQLSRERAKAGASM